MTAQTADASHDYGARPGWDAAVIGQDAPGTCHLVGCPGKGVHPPHGVPGGIGAPTAESWAEQESAARAAAAVTGLEAGITHALRALDNARRNYGALVDLPSVVWEYHDLADHLDAAAHELRAAMRAALQIETSHG